MKTEMRNGLLTGSRGRMSQEKTDVGPGTSMCGAAERVEGRQEVLDKNTFQGPWDFSNQGGRVWAGGICVFDGEGGAYKPP